MRINENGNLLLSFIKTLTIQAMPRLKPPTLIFNKLYSMKIKEQTRKLVAS